MRALAIALFAALQIHTVAPGDSAPSLAKKYYGNRDLGDLLLRYNGKAGKMIHPGDRLTVPFCEIYTSKPGDTWSGVTKRLLGQSGMAPVLAELNGRSEAEPLRTGTRIVVPVVVRVTLARGESLSSLAQRFYGDPSKAAMIREFGRIEDAKRVTVGTAIEIPTIAFLKVPSPPEPPQAIAAAPPATPEPLPSAPPVEERRFVGPLRAAEQSFLDGDYDRAKEMLEALRDRVAGDGSTEDKREWRRALAFTYVALDRDDDACSTYRSASPDAGAADLDPDLVSPRIRSVLSRCVLDNPNPPSQISPHAGT